MLLFLSVIIQVSGFSQHLTLFDVDTSSYPLVSAKFYGFDENYNILSGVKLSDCQVFENGVEQKVVKVISPKIAPKQLSVVLLVDVSGSMYGENIEFMKEVLKLYVNLTPFSYTSVALVSFNHDVFVNQDFTRDKDKLNEAIDKLQADGGTNYDAALYTEQRSALNLLKGNNTGESVVIFVTDGLSSIDSTAATSLAKQLNARVYSIALNMPLPPSLISLSLNTNAKNYEVFSEDEAKNVYVSILMGIYNQYSQIFWQSERPCNQEIYVDMQVKKKYLANAYYEIDEQQTNGLFFSKNVVLFDKYSAEDEQELKIFTHNPLTINNIYIVDTNIFDISYDFKLPKKIQEGEILKVKVKRLQNSDEQVYNKLVFETDACNPKTLYLYNGNPAFFVMPGSIEILYPNGGETFYRGQNTKIAWKNASKNAYVNVYFSNDNGKNFSYLATTTDKKFNWNIFQAQSDSCRIKVAEVRKPINFIDSSMSVKQLTISNNGDTYFWAKGKVLNISSTATGSVRKKIICESFIKDFKLSNNGDKIAIHTFDDYIQVYDLLTDKEFTIRARKKKVLGYFFSADDKKIAVVYKDMKKFMIYDAIGGKKLEKIKLDDAPRQVTASQNIISFTYGKKWRLFDMGQDTWIADFDTKMMFKISAVDMQANVACALTSDNIIYEWRFGAAKASGIFVEKGFRPTELQINSDRTILCYQRNKRVVLYRDSLKIFDFQSTRDQQITGAWFNPNGYEMTYIVKKRINDKIEYEAFRFDLKVRKLLSSNNNTHSYKAIKDVSYNKFGNVAGYKTADGYMINLLPGVFSVAGDVSDSVFSIKTFVPKIKDTVYMPKIFEGQDFSWVEKDFFQNKGNYIAVVDKVLFSAKTGGFFKIISGNPPLGINPNSNADIEFYFAGTYQIGKFFTNLYVISDDDTLNSVIVSEIVKLPVLKQTENISLGVLKINNARDKRFSIFKNITDSTLTITDVKVWMEDEEQIILNTNLKGYKILPGQAVDIDFTFNAVKRGYTNAVYKIYLQGFTQPLELVVTGQVDAPKFATVVCTTTNILDDKPVSCKVLYYNVDNGQYIGSFKTASSGEHIGTRKIRVPTELAYKFEDEFNSDTKLVDVKRVFSDTTVEIKLRVMYIGDGMKYNLKYAKFSVGSDELNSKLKKELDNLVAVMNKYPNSTILIAGHTDKEGDEQYNLELGGARAMSVKNYLVLAGIDEDRIRTISYGYSKPVSVNDTPQGRAKNRRIEITIYK